ncbi:HEPN domain-containing protein [Candidatus Pacearchaeota archaeon]|nr:HEPN domain-containing protein [Candidatus Pacearchaeota archaeon]
MNLRELNKLVGSKDFLDKRIRWYLKNKILRIQLQDRSEVMGHINKSGHNLKFIKDNLKLGYFDWCITGCYYAVYHAVLALIIERGYVSKNHDASLCVLIKEYFGQGIDEDEIVMINKFFLDYQDLLFYVQSKEQRAKATYSTRRMFDKKDVEELRLRTIAFVGKARRILQDE